MPRVFFPEAVDAGIDNGARVSHGLTGDLERATAHHSK
jgi:hypothetical protein